MPQYDLFQWQNPSELLLTHPNTDLCLVSTMIDGMFSTQNSQAIRSSEIYGYFQRLTNTLPFSFINATDGCRDILVPMAYQLLYTYHPPICRDA